MAKHKPPQRTTNYDELNPEGMSVIHDKRVRLFSGVAGTQQPRIDFTDGSHFTFQANSADPQYRSWGPQTSVSQSEMPFSRRVIIVASIVATSFSPLSFRMYASPRHTLKVCPGLMTRPRAIKRSPVAGERKFTLYSTVNTAAPGGIMERAEYPQALSTSIVTMTA